MLLIVGIQFARADVIILNNGDRITGTIDSADGGNLIIVSPIAGKITVALKDVKTFSSDEPIRVQLDDGSVINQKISPGPAGSFSTAPGGVFAKQDIPIARIGKINPPPVVWTGSVVINGLLAQGNTNSEQFGASIDAMRRTDDDRITTNAAYLYGRQKVNGITSTTDDNWHIAGSYDYFFTKKFYGYGNMRVEKDRILNLDLRLTPGVGFGYQVVERPDFNLNFEGGISWVYEEFTNEPTPNENVSARLAYHIDKTLFNSRFKVFNEIAWLPSVQNFHDCLLLTNTGFRMAITKTMFSELKAQITYDSHPAPQSRRTDAQYILGVGWTF
jgi:putative salt-induced outer membrane protein YdiY